MERGRLGKTLKDLLLAMLNATLILVALCLWLAWQASSTFQSITSDFADNMVNAEPLRADIRSLTEDLGALRADLGALRDQSGAIRSETTDQTVTRLTAVETRISGLASRIEQLVAHPEDLIDHAIDSAARAATQSIANIRGCTHLPTADSSS